MPFPILQLKKNECRRLRAGHLWVFSNEVDTKTTPLTQFTPGESVTVVSSNGEKIGNAYVNPHALICARIYSHNNLHKLDEKFLRARIGQAFQLRESYFDKPFYRMIYGESDLLPGLTVDRFENTLVVQTSTLGMDLIQTQIVEVLDSIVNPDTIILKNNTGARKLENLKSFVEVVKGTAPETLHVEENGTRFECSALQGQKTGWFYDHRANRKTMQQWAHNKNVLDVFSYVGGWGIQAAVAGANQVSCVESSEAACKLIESNALLNDVSERVTVMKDDAFDSLIALAEDQKKFDIIILDPPAFIKRKKDIKQGAAAYQRLNKLAMQLMTENGILISASCSFHFPRNQHLKVLRNSAYKLRYQLQILEEGRYAPDHPVHPSIPETDYLTCFTARLLKE